MKVTKAVLLLTLALPSALCSALVNPDIDDHHDDHHLLHAMIESEEVDERRFIVKYKTGRRGLRGRRKAQDLGVVVMSLERDGVDFRHHRPKLRHGKNNQRPYRGRV